MEYAIKKPAGYLWSGKHTQEKVEEKVKSGSIRDDWLICPFGRAERAVSVEAFFKNPDILKPKKREVPKPQPPLPLSTTSEMPGKTIAESRGIVCGTAILGVDMFRDIAAAFSDTFGGRSTVYESEMNQAREYALEELMEKTYAVRGEAVVGVKIDYESVGSNGKLLLVSITGTAVTLAPGDD